ncbi:MAG: hypothetical protein A6F71_00670 [Cycloclasticus sp. symbiont of Poecilosclerida sp. M]|nr:MAG: hypothetical protein A6F71_00670 [Cycloclasticus sp. symbiont of Poecilosclerida sp. M]
MCLILLKHQPADHYKLILIANRDEYHQRETLPARYWPQQPHIFGGIDCSGGGSWLSVDTAGRLAAVTNVRKPPYVENDKKSRGKIVSDFLSHQQSADEFLNDLTERDSQYGLFNLVLMDKSGLWHYSSDDHQSQKISTGIHGLCNATLDTPWPKLTSGLSGFKQSLDKEKVIPLELLSVLQSQERPNDKDLPDTGVGLEFERFLSSIFIQGEEYGTRCTTLLTIDDEALQFLELSYDPIGNITGEVQQQIALRS